MGKKKKASEPKPRKLSKKRYESALTQLHAELVKLQYWVQAKGLRIIIVFEGRDAAGKGGIIKRIVDRVSPRVFRIVALPTPSEREKTQLYLQRYIQHFPAAGEVVIFDRSWYNRAGVERVMGFCTDKEYQRFLHYTPTFEQMIVDAGIQLIKYWLDTSMAEQERRFQDRIDDPRKIWKLSTMDVESYRRWYDYSQARDKMLRATDTHFAPWYIVPADDKKRARLNCISHFLSLIPYEELPIKPVKLGKRDLSNQYDDHLSLKGRRFIPQNF
ncbi:MAG: polyphosphate kinase 2 [Roseofilum sp. SBFL]|uniref:polyphosphate kinase 2 n=1 Tax=unclassified Roseofilum TaxID=2620099 RepID=UPI001B1C73E4|nr:MULTISPECIES: polyphosphate kinase 2 [unclassified Roseofilum]MBP0015414.1 polyphosphate kinase 2 [Roseofilum sp. SID3]MBP0024975.1 polyphosphate kinase 2 [Roseofilum sp. SID2]MBP0040226.1 polyphosphate kinase 2 [Roseofilum sp. SID1]MBP0043539.1 polyphosphate kinase 2 [Roseofilum sp. SBFL]